MDTTSRENHFEVGYEAYHEDLGLFCTVVDIDGTDTMVEFEDGSHGWFPDQDLLYRDTAECMLGLCDCEWDDDGDWIDDIGLDSMSGY